MLAHKALSGSTPGQGVTQKWAFTNGVLSRAGYPFHITVNSNKEVHYGTLKENPPGGDVPDYRRLA